MLLAAAGSWVVIGDGRAGILQSESAADRYFRALSAPEGAGPLTDFRRHDLDGMQNADASGSYQVQLPGKEVLRHYRAACRRSGLRSPPSRETLTYYPDALCDGAVIVTVKPHCTRARCNVFVEVIGA